MVSYVTIEEARIHLMVDTLAHDPWLNIMIPSISGAVLSWLKDAWRAYELEVDDAGNVIYDSNGEGIPIEDSNGPIVHPIVKAATLVELAVQFRFRDGTEYDRTATGDLYSGRYGYILSQGPTSLLHGLRKPTVK